jgi:hypothetical protein
MDPTRAARRARRRGGRGEPRADAAPPYRAYRAIAPLTHYLRALHAQRPQVTLTVVLPELVARHAWYQLLHSRAPRGSAGQCARCQAWW